MKGAALRSRQLGGGEGNPVLIAGVEADLKRVLPCPGEGEVENQHRPGLDVGDPRRRLPELDGPFAFHQGRPLLVHEPDPHGVVADFRPPTAHPKHQVCARMDRWKRGNPDVLKQSQHRELSLLVDQGIVGEHRKVEKQLTPP